MKSNEKRLKRENDKFENQSKDTSAFNQQIHYTSRLRMNTIKRKSLTIFPKRRKFWSKFEKCINRWIIENLMNLPIEYRKCQRKDHYCEKRNDHKRTFTLHLRARSSILQDHESIKILESSRYLNMIWSKSKIKKRIQMLNLKIF